MTLHLNLPGSHHRSAAQHEELREARRQLKEKIRNDWDYPPLPAHRSSGRHPPGTVSDPTAFATTTDIEDRIAGFRFHTPPSASVPGENGRPAEGSAAHVLGLDFEPTEWRAREDGSEDDDEDSSSADTRIGGTVHKGKKSGESIRFDRPDSVAVELEERRQARKRRRLGMLEEEVQWNDGLAHWFRRRDVWCCARGAEEVRSVEEAQSHAGAQHSRTTTSSSSSAAASMTSASSARSSTSSASPQSNAASLNTPITTPSTSPPIPDSTVDSSSHPTNQPSTLPPSLQPILLPIAPPLLPTHPIRTRITPAQHPEIYSKIILQSRTPSVPINLQTLIRALVQGWISDGEWPPKPGVVERSFARRKLKDGEGVGSVVKGGIRKVLRLTGVGGGGGVDVVK